MPTSVEVPSSSTVGNRALAAKAIRMVTKLKDYHGSGREAGRAGNKLSIREFADKNNIGAMTMRQARAFARLYSTEDLKRWPRCRTAGATASRTCWSTRGLRRPSMRLTAGGHRSESR